MGRSRNAKLRDRVVLMARTQSLALSPKRRMVYAALLRLRHNLSHTLAWDLERIATAAGTSKRTVRLALPIFIELGVVESIETDARGRVTNIKVHRPEKAPGGYSRVPWWWLWDDDVQPHPDAAEILTFVLALLERRDYGERTVHGNVPPSFNVERRTVEELCRKVKGLNPHSFRQALECAENHLDDAIIIRRNSNPQGGPGTFSFNLDISETPPQAYRTPLQREADHLRLALRYRRSDEARKWPLPSHVKPGGSLQNQLVLFAAQMLNERMARDTVDGWTLETYEYDEWLGAASDLLDRFDGEEVDGLGLAKAWCLFAARTPENARDFLSCGLPYVASIADRNLPEDFALYARSFGLAKIWESLNAIKSSADYPDLIEVALLTEYERRHACAAANQHFVPLSPDEIGLLMPFMSKLRAMLRFDDALVVEVLRRSYELSESARLRGPVGLLFDRPAADKAARFVRDLWPAAPELPVSETLAAGIMSALDAYEGYFDHDPDDWSASVRALVAVPLVAGAQAPLAWFTVNDK